LPRRRRLRLDHVVEHRIRLEPAFAARSSIWFESALVVVRPLTSGIRPAAEMILAACGVIMNLRNSTASLGCFRGLHDGEPSRVLDDAALLGRRCRAGDRPRCRRLLERGVSQLPSDIAACRLNALRMPTSSKFMMTPQAAKIISAAGLIPDVKGLTTTNALSNQMLDLAAKGGLSVSMLDNVIQSRSDVAGKQPLAAFPARLPRRRRSRACRRAQRACRPPAGLDPQVGTGVAPAASSGATLLRNASSARAHRSTLNAQPQRAGMLFSLPVSRSSARCSCTRSGSRYYSITQWDGLTAPGSARSTYSNGAPQPGFSAVLEEQRDAPAGGSGAIGHSVVVAFLLLQPPAGLALFPHGVFLPTAVSWVVIGAIAARFSPTRASSSACWATSASRTSIRTCSRSGSALAAVAITFIWGMSREPDHLPAGMSTIDTSLYEAAKVDGAGQLLVSYRSRLPLLRMVRAVRVHITSFSPSRRSSA